MSALFLVSLFVGLAFGSLVMWRGVERYDRRSPATDAYGRELPSQPVGHLALTIAATTLVFGAVGYQLLQRSSLDRLAVVGIAAASGLLAAFVAFIAVARWIVPAARLSPDDPRYSLQGFPGKVLAPIDTTDTGEIGYEANGRSVTVKARSVDGSGIPSGTEIAIDRLEDGVAYVELWSHVEGRL